MPMDVCHANIPSELKNKNLWCVWKGDKIPRSLSGAPLKSTEPLTWHPFLDAISQYSLSDYDGIGFCLTASGIVGIDLDDCITSSLELKPWARKVLSLLPEGAYIEYSPSGEGLHVLVSGHKPSSCTACKKLVQDAAGVRLGEIEIYDNARYFTVTGNLFGDSGACIVDGQSHVEDLCAKLWPPPVPAAEKEGRSRDGKAGQKPPEPAQNTMNVDQILDVIKSSSQWSKFRTLAFGSLNEAMVAYGQDHSRAVYAFCAIVAWYTKDFGQCDYLFRRSSLYSGKWSPDPDANGGRGYTGKWRRLGELQFRKLRAGYEAVGDFYEPGHGRLEATADFGSYEAILTAEKERTEVASYQEHVALLEELGEVRRDLLTSCLHLKRSESNGYAVWEPVFTKSMICSLRGECRHRRGGLKSSYVEDYLYRLEQSLEPKILLDLPLWDGQDRIAFMCSKVKCESVTEQIFTDLVKDWCAKMYLKLLDPLHIQNRCILLSGKQGIGKDVWIRSLFCALGPYLRDLVTAGKHTSEADLSVVMGGCAVLCISEFDKVSALGPGVLKDLITKPTFTQVRKYDRDASTALNRCSVIAACNPEHILDDSTGNRRFLLFRLSGGPRHAINWEYPKENPAFSLQVLSQGKALADAGYCASVLSESAMVAVQAESTPDSAEDMIVEDFESAIKERSRRDELSGNPGLYLISDLDSEFTQLARNHGIKRQQLLTVLKRAGCYKRKHAGRYYGTRAACQMTDDPLGLEPSTTWEDGFN